MDPLFAQYPANGTYNFSENRVVDGVELEGKEYTNIETKERSDLINASTINTVIQQLSFSYWNDLINHVAPESVIKDAQSRNSSVERQPLENASGNQLNFDYYSIEIESLPANKQGYEMTPNEFFTYVRKNFADFVDGNTSMEAYSSEDNKVWNSNNPLSAVMRFDVYQNGINTEDMSVVTSDYYVGEDGSYWTFVPVFTVGDGYHPLSGVRQFGMTINRTNTGGVTYTFYTRAIDVPYTKVDAVASDMIFEGADILWNTVMYNLVNYINENKGDATYTTGTSEQTYIESPADSEKK